MRRYLNIDLYVLIEQHLLIDRSQNDENIINVDFPHGVTQNIPEIVVPLFDDPDVETQNMPEPVALLLYNPHVEIPNIPEPVVLLVHHEHALPSQPSQTSITSQYVPETRLNQVENQDENQCISMISSR